MYRFARLLESELVDKYEQGGYRCQEDETFCHDIQQAFHVGPVHPAGELYVFYIHDES